MQKRWLKENVAIALLADRICQFFKSKEFDFTMIETDNGYQIIAGNSPRYKMNSNVQVTIDESSEDFILDLELLKKDRRFKFPIILSAMFGGGYFLLKNLKSEESWGEFQRDFWQSMKIIILALKDSANP
jgi:hypothetical protein